MSCKMAISCISGSMYKIFVILVLFAVPTFAQVPEDEDPDASGTAMPNVDITEAVPIIEVIEGVGMVRFANIAFRQGPDSASKILRYSMKSEKVLIIGESGEWLKVRMYNNIDAFINKQYVALSKIFRDESTTVNSMDKKVSFEITDLLSRFNTALRNSPFAARYMIIPSLSIVDSRKQNGKISMTLVYSCVDLEGKMVPSYKDNGLSSKMRQLLELVFMKLLLSGNEGYEVMIKVPTFADNGTVTDISKVYAIVSVDYAKVNMDMIKADSAKLWDYASSTVPIDDLFIKFP